jgi:hypothetical protein
LDQLGKLLLLAGLALAAVGALVWGLAALGLRKLPGDWLFQTDRVTIFVPIASCLILSAILTLAVWLWQWLSK